jgi:hypothetical protein
MNHELTTNPIKLRIVDLKTNTYNRSYVFVGSVSDDIRHQLQKVEAYYNKHHKIIDNAKLKKFYGVNWSSKLGLIKHKTVGGGDKYNEFTDLVSSMIVGGNVNNNVISDESETFNIDPLIDNYVNNVNESSEVNNVKDLGNINELSEVNNVNEINEQIEVTINDIDNININTTNLFEEHKKTNTVKKTGDVEFIFDIDLYPSDTILEFKYKIYTALDIPIYRQHLYFKNSDKTYTASYILSVSKHNLTVDIETLSGYYMGTKTMDTIESVPVDVNMYKHKDFLHITALDTFNILLTNWQKYNTTEYFLVDLDDLIDSGKIYDKLRNDKYQMEMIYYGFIIVYFPMITLSVWYNYIKNEKSISEMFPSLQPSKNQLRKQFDIESDITNQSLVSYEKKDKIIMDNLYSSITSTIVSIDNHKQDIEMLLVLRNIFDTLELTDIIVYCKANLLHNNQNIVLKKSFQNEKEPKDVIPINSLLIKIKTTADTNENMRLILFKNGNYIIKTDWREENSMTFSKITQVTSSKVNKIINTINSLSTKVKYYDVTIPLLTKSNAQFTETSMIFYYDTDLTESKYNILKTILEDFRRAGIVHSKESTNSLDFFFNKGMYKFDATRIEKSITLSNYYEYLSNAVVSQKWATIFEHTRLMQFINTSSKLKIAISGIKNDTEMEIFYTYLIGLLDIYLQNSKDIKIHHNDSLHKSKRALKNLKIQDPILYDFKKIYKSNVVYSKICQKPYQPVMLNDSEYKSLSSQKKETAVKYWNFTKQQPVWYSCPGTKYPYIKFIVKQHPKDFCIPCCKKIEMSDRVNVIKQLQHSTCLTKHEFLGEKQNLIKSSHYIATYGKDLEVGRLSRLPENTLEPLFFDTYSPGGIDPECMTSDGYYLFGIEQSLPNIKQIGYLFCLVHALNKSVDDFLLDCSVRIKKQPDRFHSLLEGNANMYFTSAIVLANVISTLSTALLDYIYEPVQWNLLFMSIAYYYYGVNTVLFDDQSKERIDLELPKGLKSVDEMFPSSHKNLVVLRKKTKYYPIYLLNSEMFKRTGIIDTRLFLNESGLLVIITAVVRRYLANQTALVIHSEIDLTVIRKFTNECKLTIVAYFINYNNLAYGVLVEFNKYKCYLPISPSHYSLDSSIEYIYTPYDETYNTPYDVFKKLMSMYNNWLVRISTSADLGSVLTYPKISVEKWLVVKNKEYDSKLENSKSENNLIIGFVSNGVYYYIQHISKKIALSYVKCNIQLVLYNPIEINKLIYKMKQQKTITSDVTFHNKLQYAIYKYYLYDLILLQFIAIFNKQRNIPLRKRIISTIAKTNFDKDTTSIKNLIAEITDVEDNSKLKHIIARYINVHHDKKLLLDDVVSSYFNFDRIILEELKTMDYKHVLNHLHQLAKKFVKFGNIEKIKNFHFPNMLVSCDVQDSNYCDKGKFIITREQLDDVLSVLAADIINPAKWKWLFNSVFIEKSVDYFRFIRRPNETITVEFL